MISILYVDDWLPLLDITRRFLEKTGDMIVDTSYSSEEALKKMDRIFFDVIVTDYNLKESLSFDLLRLARLKGITSPFVFFTSVKNFGIEEKVMQYGPVAFVPKIFTSSSSFEMLEKTIRTIVPASHSGNIQQRNDPIYLM
jgi:DNA-binding NarL/FixJ family response regulator